MDGLYSGAPLPASWEDDECWFNDGSKELNDSIREEDNIHLNLSVGSEDDLNSSFASEDENLYLGDEEDNEEYDTPEKLMDCVRKRLHLCDNLLQRTQDLSERYSIPYTERQFAVNRNEREVPDRPSEDEQQVRRVKCSIAGIGKFRRRILSEKNNFENLMEALEEGLGSSGETAGSQIEKLIAKGVLLLRCSTLGSLDCTLYCAEREPDVTGLGVMVRHGRESAEVDVVSVGGLRWIKVRTSSRRNLEREFKGEAVDFALSVFRFILKAAQHTKHPFGAVPQFALFFAHKPLRKVIQDLEQKGIVVTHLEAARVSPNIFPSISLKPEFICLDTTALIALCSETCFVKEAELEQGLNRLKSFKVLTDQLVKEQSDFAVKDHIDKHLRDFTCWIKKEELMRKLGQFMGQYFEKNFDEDERRTFKSKANISLCVKPSLDWLEHLQREWEEVAEKIDPLRESSVISSAHARLKENRFSAGEEAESNVIQEMEKQEEVINWFISDITYHEFKWMIETLAGPSEVRRAARILKLLTVINTEIVRKTPASSEIGNHALRVTSKVSLRNKIVFTTADILHAVTISSNIQLVKGAREQKVFFFVREHPTRSLTEQKLRSLPRRPGPPQPPAFDYGK